MALKFDYDEKKYEDKSFIQEAGASSNKLDQSKTMTVVSSTAPRRGATLHESSMLKADDDRDSFCSDKEEDK